MHRFSKVTTFGALRIYRNGWTGRAVFWQLARRLSSTFHTVLIVTNLGKPIYAVSPKIGLSVFPSETLLPNPRLRKFRHGTSIIGTSWQLSSTKVDGSLCDKPATVVGRRTKKLIIHATVDIPPIDLSQLRNSSSTSV